MTDERKPEKKREEAEQQSYLERWHQEQDRAHKEWREAVYAEALAWWRGEAET